MRSFVPSVVVVLVSLATNALAADPPKNAAPAKKKTAHRAETTESERAADKAGTKKADAKTRKGKKAKPKPPCFAEAVEIQRGAEGDKFSLTLCDGTLAPTAVEHLSVLARPGSAAKPEKAWADLAKVKSTSISPGIRRVDPGLAARLETVVQHFTKDGKTPRLSVISGYRPASVGSFHASGKALDFRVEGIANEALVAFCKTLPDTGCGYYPNSSFVHMDVRPAGTGHVQWIDASGPGENPHYVSAWPAPPDPVAPNGDPTSPNDLQPLPVDEHPADPSSVTLPTELPYDTVSAPSDFDAKNGEADPARM